MQTRPYPDLQGGCLASVDGVGIGAPLARKIVGVGFQFQIEDFVS
jgi:hypothetical protein